MQAPPALAEHTVCSLLPRVAICTACTILTDAAAKVCCHALIAGCLIHPATSHSPIGQGEATASCSTATCMSVATFTFLSRRCQLLRRTSRPLLSNAILPVRIQCQCPKKRNPYRCKFGTSLNKMQGKVALRKASSGNLRLLGPAAAAHRPEQHANLLSMQYAGLCHSSRPAV